MCVRARGRSPASLTFPGHVVEDGRERASYDATSGELLVHIPKAVPGEHFPDLDLLTALLARKSQVAGVGPLVEVVAPGTLADANAAGRAGAVDGPADPDAEGTDDDDDDDWTLPQHLPVRAGPPRSACSGRPSSGLIGSRHERAGTPAPHQIDDDAPPTLPGATDPVVR